MSPVFPIVFWGATRAAFILATEEAMVPLPVRAVIVVALSGDRFVLADIAGRGWCTPSGRVEPGESWEQAARREAWEEAGATLGELRLIGYYTLTNTTTNDSYSAPTYVAHVSTLDTLPPGFESLGVERFALSELPATYYTWDALLETVLRYASESAP